MLIFKLWCLWRAYRGASALASGVVNVAPYVAGGLAGLTVLRYAGPPVFRLASRALSGAPDAARAAFPATRWARLPASPAPTW